MALCLGRVAEPELETAAEARSYFTIPDSLMTTFEITPEEDAFQSGMSIAL
jgi:hypothetical protein